MDLLSLYYFSETVKDMHITKAANRLYVSQQTLSNHIIRLEEYYGTKLFNRKPTLSLTYAGEIVLRFAEMVYREDKNILDRLADIKNQKQGLILFGASTLRMSSCLPNILPKFSKQFPDIEIRITDANSKILEEKILRGDLDLAIAISADTPDIAKIHLMYDQIYLCVTNHLLQKYYDNEAETLKEKSYLGADVKDFSRLPFCMLDNQLGQNIQKCFIEADFSPKVFTTSSYIQISTSIGLQGLAACFATRTSLLNLEGKIPKDICIFPLFYKGKPLTQDIFLIHHKKRYLTSYINYFIDLTKNYFYEVEKLSIKDLIEN